MAPHIQCFTVTLPKVLNTNNIKNQITYIKNDDENKYSKLISGERLNGFVHSVEHCCKSEQLNALTCAFQPFVGQR